MADLHVTSAICRYELPRHAGARAAAVASDTLERFPEAAGAKAVLGFVRTVVEGEVNGFALLNEAVQHEPEDWIIRFYRGWALGGLGRFDEAVADMEEGLRLSPPHAGGPDPPPRGDADPAADDDRPRRLHRGGKLAGPP